MKHTINPIQFHKIPVGLAVKDGFFFHRNVSLPEGNPTSWKTTRGPWPRLCCSSVAGASKAFSVGIRMGCGSGKPCWAVHSVDTRGTTADFTKSYRYLTVDIQRYRSIYPAIYLSIHPSIHLSIHPSIHPSIFKQHEMVIWLAQTRISSTEMRGKHQQKVWWFHQI